MGKLSATGQKFLKIFHLIFVASWTGSGLALGVISWVGPILMKDDLYSVYFIMSIIDIYLIMPLVIGTLIIGLIFSFFTNWGFYKHSWIAVKWVIFIIQIPIGALFLKPIVTTNVSIAKLEQGLSLNNPVFLHNQQLFHFINILQFSLLILLICISVLKPWRRAKTV